MVRANPGTGSYKRIYEELGLQAMDDRGEHPDDLLVKLDPIARRILAVPATTLAGLSVKARLAKFSEPDLWKENDTDADWGDLCVRKLVDAAIELAASA